MVNIGGYWFNLDVTWDDPIPDIQNRIRYNYFLLSDKTFRLDHTPDKTNLPIA